MGTVVLYVVALVAWSGEQSPAGNAAMVTFNIVASYRR